jgi:hypothetical protein
VKITRARSLSTTGWATASLAPIGITMRTMATPCALSAGFSSTSLQGNFRLSPTTHRPRIFPVAPPH